MGKKYWLKYYKSGYGAEFSLVELELLNEWWQVRVESYKSTNGPVSRFSTK